MEYAIGKAAKSDAPITTSQVSLPSQKGEIVAIIASRRASFSAMPNRTPTPRSKPSRITYTRIATAITATQNSARVDGSTGITGVIAPSRAGRQPAAGPAADG